MSKYLNDSIIQQFSIIGDVINNEDDVTLSEIIASLVLENNANEYELYRNRSILNLPDEHPSSQFLLAKKSILETIITLLGFYLQYLIDNRASIPKQEYGSWATNYNDFYKTQPLSIFDSIKPPTGINTNDEEFELYQQIKTAINPVSNNNNNYDTGIGVFYHVIEDITKRNQIKFTKKLPSPIQTNLWYFFKSPEDVSRYYKENPLYLLDTSVDPPQYYKAFKIVLAKCLIRLEFIDKIPGLIPTDVEIYSVNDIYDYYVTVDDVFDHTLFAPFTSARITRRVSRGRP